jgi:hypothetical protein
MPQNLEKRNGVWYATVLVPTDVREALGMTRFKKSLGTPNEREAVRLGAPYIASWWAQIKQARGNTSAVVTEAQRWKRALEKAPDEDKGHSSISRILSFCRTPSSLVPYPWEYITGVTPDQEH